MKKIFITALITLVAGSSVLAAVPKHTSKTVAAPRSIIADGVLRRSAGTKKVNKYIEDGVIYGGQAGVGYSLMDIRRFYSGKDRIERLIFEMGNERGQPSKNLGYFQVNLNKNLRRIDVDLSQMRGAALDQKKIADLFKASPFVQNVKMNYDPEDRAILMQVFLKQNVEMEVFQIPAQNKFSRIAIDMRKVANAKPVTKARAIR